MQCLLMELMQEFVLPLFLWQQTNKQKIIISVTAGFRHVVAQQFDWIVAKLGAQWEERVIVSLDKVMIVEETYIARV